jgi:hypothetical protein
MRPLSLSPPIILDQVVNHLAKGIALGRRQAGLFVLGKDSKKEHRHILTAKQIDNPCTAALATRPETEPYLANSAATGDEYSACWVGSESIDNGGPFGGRKSLSASTR